MSEQSERSENRILIITPAKDEGEYIARTIRSLESQTHRPALWVIVNDGSSDDTGAIADAAAEKHDWIRVLHRPAGTKRRVGPGVIEAFYAGLNTVDLNEFDYVTKMDADIVLQPEYFEILMGRFAENERLGTISGKCYVPVEGELVLERTGDQFSHGVAKLFRRECFQEIGGFVRQVMWDGIDCHRCRMFGWDAISDSDPRLQIVHLRLMGSSFKSVYHGRVRWGRGQYFMGTHPLYLFGISAYRMAERPWILGGLCLLYGYFQAMVTGMERYNDSQFRAYLRKWQMQELRNRFGRMIGLTPKSAETFAYSDTTSRETYARLDQVMATVDDALAATQNIVEEAAVVGSAN